jgi:hypothetical protein
LVLPFAYPEIKEDKKTKKDIFSRTAGILSSKNIDPIEWQDKMVLSRIDEIFSY